MNGNRKIKRLMSLAMSGVLTVGMGMNSVYAADPALEKEETVYVRTGAGGDLQDVIVSDWLKNKDGAATITDTTTLHDVENVKGDETFSIDGDSMTWNANGNDIFYQGKLDKDLPVSLKVTYFLDGKEMSPEEIAGKTGHVRIKYEYTNHLKNGDIYTPFLLVTGMILDGETFKNVTVDHGKVVNDGNRDIVVGFGLPGTQESLDVDFLKEKVQERYPAADFDLDIPSGFEVEADAENFSTKIAMTMAMPLDLSELDLTDADDWDDVQDKIEELKDNVTKLVDGTSDLADGVQELRDGCDDLLDGMTALDDGAGDLEDGAAKLDDGMKELDDGVQTLNEKKGALVDGVKELSDGLNQLDGKKLTLANGIAAIADGANSLQHGAGDLKKGMGQLYAGIKELDKKRPQLVSGVKQLVTGINQIDSNKENLTEGAAAVAAGVQSVSSNLQQAEAGSKQVTDGLTQVNQTLPAGLDQLSGGLTQISDGIDDNLKEDGTLQVQLGTLTGGIKQYVDSVNTFANALYTVSEDGTGSGYFANADQVYAGITQVDEGLGQIIQLLEGIAGPVPTPASEGPSSYDSLGSAGEAATADPAAAIAALEASIEGDQAVLASLYDVRDKRDTVPDALLSQYSDAYNVYSAQLDTCIAQMEADIANEQQALEVLKAAANTPAPVNNPGGAIPPEMLQTLLGSLKTLKKSTEQLSGAAIRLTGADQQLEQSAAALAGAGQQITDGVSTAKTQIAGSLTTISAAVKQANAGVDQIRSSLYGENGAMPQLENGSAQVTSGISQIADGVSTQLLPGCNTLSDGIETLFTSGIDIVADGLNRLGEKMPELDNGISALKSGAGELYKGTKTLKTGTGKLAKGTDTLNAGTGELVDGIGLLAAGGETLKAGTGTLAEGVGALAEGSSQLKEGTGELAEGTKTLKEGTKDLKDGGLILTDGVQAILDGSIELRDGVAQFDEEGIQRITEFLEDDLKEVIDRWEDVKEASTTYHLFSEDSDNENDSVKFIIETDGIN